MLTSNSFKIISNISHLLTKNYATHCMALMSATSLDDSVSLVQEDVSDEASKHASHRQIFGYKMQISSATENPNITNLNLSNSTCEADAFPLINSCNGLPLVVEYDNVSFIVLDNKGEISQFELLKATSYILNSSVRNF